MRPLVLLLFIVIINQNVWAVKKIASVSGNWSATATWGGAAIPTSTDTVVVQAGKTVTVDGTLTSCGVLEVFGILKFSGSAPILVVNGSLTIMAGGDFRPYGNAFAVNGSFVNNGMTDLSRAGTILRMGTPSPAITTSISGTGVFASGVVYVLRIDNTANVNLSVPLSVSNTLALWRGALNNGANLTLNNTNLGNSTTANPAVKLVRQQKTSLGSPYALSPAATLNIEYTRNTGVDPELVVAGHELSPGRVFNSLLVDNIAGVSFGSTIALNAASDALKLVSGIVTVASGQTIICKNKLYRGTSGAPNSFVNGAVCLSVGLTVADSLVYPLGTGNQNRKLVIKGVRNDLVDTGRVRFSILNVTGGTPPGGTVLANSVRWLGTNMVSGGNIVFTSVGLGYGPGDNCYLNGNVLQSGSTTGAFTGLGSGSNTAERINSPSGSYVLKCFAIGSPVLSYTDDIVVTSLPPSYKQYRKSEWDLGVSTSFSNINPYNDTDIAVDMLITSPSSKAIKLPCFYVADKGLQKSKWKARFSPQETGIYSYKFQFSKAGVVVYSTTSASFNATAADTGDNGLLHYSQTADNPWILNYDSGKPFRGLGNNIGWENRDDEANPTYTYEYFLPKLATNGANFIRTFMTNYNLPIEWNNVELQHKNSRYKNSSELYNPSGIKRMDEFIEMADANKLHVMLMIEWQCNLRPDVNWDYNPYNVVNGGPAATPKDFFTDPTAKRMFKNRLRYMIARWGYSPAIGMWELMNEIDNALYKTQTDGGNPTFTDIQVIPDSCAVNWHRDMAQYLKDNDPYRHIITTSIGFRTISGLWSVPNIDINQEHMYNYTDKIPSRLVNRDATYNRPHVIGEFARDYINPSPSRWDIFNFDFKKGLWYGLFNPIPVLPINWFWVLWETENGFGYYNRVKEINQRILEAGQGSISHIATTSTDTIIVTKGIKAGSKYMVHILHNKLSGSNISANVGIVLLPNTSYLVQLYNPETNAFSYYNPSQLSYTSSGTGHLSFSFANLTPQKQLILILTDLSGSGSLMSFNVSTENNFVRLDWGNNGQDIERSVLERSGNGKDFVGIFSGKGQKNTFFDQAPITGSNYYRLTQYSNNGDLVYQAKKLIRFQNLSVESRRDHNRIDMNMPGFLGNRLYVRMVGLNGQTIYEDWLSVSDASAQIHLKKSIPSGVYILKVQGEEFDKVVKFVY